MERRFTAPAARFHAHGVASRDVVGLPSGNNVEFLTTIVGVNHIAATDVPLNWRLVASEPRLLLYQAGARAPVCDEALVKLADEGRRSSTALSMPSAWSTRSRGPGSPPSRCSARSWNSGECRP
jgi:acyl-CoA synthetase (AMP-forming)/AMP-acid ligase II